MARQKAVLRQSLYQALFAYGDALPTVSPREQPREEGEEREGSEGVPSGSGSCSCLARGALAAARARPRFLITPCLSSHPVHRFFSQDGALNVAEINLAQAFLVGLNLATAGAEYFQVRPFLGGSVLRM